MTIAASRAPTMQELVGRLERHLIANLDALRRVVKECCRYPLSPTDQLSSTDQFRIGALLAALPRPAALALLPAVTGLALTTAVLGAGRHVPANRALTELEVALAESVLLIPAQCAITEEAARRDGLTSTDPQPFRLTMTRSDRPPGAATELAELNLVLPDGQVRPFWLLRHGTEA